MASVTVTAQQLVDIAKSDHFFLKDLRCLRKSKKLEEFAKGKERLSRALRYIEWQDERNTGLGYASPSAHYDREKELFLAAYVKQAFEENDNKTVVLTIPIDEFYRFAPGNPSLVGKVKIFNELAEKEFPGTNFAVLLTCFSDSAIFTESILEKVPNQNNAGMNVFQTITPSGGKVFTFARKLPLLSQKANGDVSAILEEVKQATKADGENAKLVLTLGLLLQDCQAWQCLWYESRKHGTPLYIVAPTYFHDAMNRLNLSWGHGGTDYRYRASLGNFDADVFENEDADLEALSYLEQGMSAEEFEKRISLLVMEEK